MRSNGVVLVVAGLSLFVACNKKQAAQEGPTHKNKEEFLKVLDSHRDEYVRCEKLRRAATTGGPLSSGTPSTATVDYQACTTRYWATVKREVGPYDQAKADEWYAEWSKGVKIE